MNKSVLIAGGVIIIVLGVGVFFALKRPNQDNDAVNQPVPQKAVPSAPANNQGSFNNEIPPSTDSGRPPRPSGGAMPNFQLPEGSQPFFGTVSNFDSSSFTVQGPRDTLKILVTSSTEFKGGTSSDLKDDVQIMGYGTKNTDNTITALQIQLNASVPERGQFPSR